MTARAAVKTFLLEETPESVEKVRRAISTLTEEVQSGQTIFADSGSEQTVTTIDDRARTYAADFEEVLK